MTESLLDLETETAEGTIYNDIIQPAFFYCKMLRSLMFKLLNSFSLSAKTQTSKLYRMSFCKSELGVDVITFSKDMFAGW